MKEELIQTLHPKKDKTNKKISLDKYNFIKENILMILSELELTHSELMEELYSRVKDNFEGGVQWYGAAVKLDLEARQTIGCAIKSSHDMTPKPKPLLLLDY